jgi:hypothetical protein
MFPVYPAAGQFESSWKEKSPAGPPLNIRTAAANRAVKMEIWRKNTLGPFDPAEMRGRRWTALRGYGGTTPARLTSQSERSPTTRARVAHMRFRASSNWLARRSRPYSDQLLVTRKFWSLGANRPSQARVEIAVLRVIQPTTLGRGFTPGSLFGAPVSAYRWYPAARLADRARSAPGQ